LIIVLFAISLYVIMGKNDLIKIIIFRRRGRVEEDE